MSPSDPVMEAVTLALCKRELHLQSPWLLSLPTCVFKQYIVQREKHAAPFRVDNEIDLQQIIVNRFDVYFKKLIPQPVQDI